MLSILLCLTMLLSCVPTAVFAAEGDSVCTCQTKCAEGSVNTECTVCSADLTACIAAAAATLPRYLYVGGVTVVEEYTVSAVTSGEGWRYDTATATLYLTDGAAIRYTSTTEECLENGLYCSNGTLKVHASGTVSITGYGDGIRLPDGTLELYAAEGSNITITGTSAGSEGIYSTVNTNSIRISGKGTVNVSASDGASYGMTAAGNIYIDGVTLNVGGTSNYDDISAANVLIGQTEAAVVNCLGPTCSGIGGTLTQKVGIYNGSIVHLAEKTTEKSWLLGFHAKTIEIADSTVVMDGLTGAYSIYAMHGASTVSGASHILIRKMVSTENGAYGLTVGYDPYQLTGEAGYYTRSDAAAEFTADGDITEIYIGYFELYYPSHMSYHSNGDGTHYYGCPATCPAAIKGENEECSGTATCAEPVVCESCGAVRQLPHSYDNEADTDCNACGALRYDIWVAGVRVTEENASDVLGDGTVSYDGAANTLTLNGATVDASALAVPALEVSGEPLTLVLQGTNALTGSAQVLSSVDEAGNTIWYGEPAISIAGGTVLTITGDETATLTLLGNDFAYTANDHIPSASSISGGSLNVAGGTITTNNGIRLSGDYSQTGGSVEAGFLEAQNVTVSDGILNAKGNSGICPKYADPHAGGIHGIFANNTINISGGNVTTESGIVGHNGDYCGNMSVTGETITTHGLYALESVSITGGTVTSTGCVGGYVIDPFGFLTLGHYTEDDVTPSGPAPGSALEAPDWSISEEATFICGSETSHRGGTATCTLGAICDFCGAGYGETDTSIHDTVNAQYTNGFCDCCGIYDAPELVDDVYQIGNAGQLYWFAQQVNSGKPYINAVLTADITINKNVLIDGELNPDTTVVNGFRTWTPIGKGTDHSYYGSFDGQNHSISGLYYQGGDFYVGLFGYLSYGAVVKNLKLTDSYFNVDASGTSHFYAGGIAASLTGGRIENCRNEANLRVNYDYSADVGGIVGFVSTNGTVSHCRNSGKLHGGNTDILSIGGIVGTAVGVITDCGNTGDIIVDNGVNTIVGGVSNGGTLENCFNTGSFDITSTVFYPGGISGRSATVTNCYYLMGVADEGIEGEDSEGAIQAMSQEAFASGEVAYLLNGGVTDGTQSWYQTIGTDATPELSGDTVYYGYTGCMDTTQGYGNDAVYTTVPEHEYAADGFCTICGSTQGATRNGQGVYEIGNAGQLMWFAKFVNLGNKGVDAVLTADIDMSDIAWTPICSTALYNSADPAADGDWGYTGTFDGQGHVICNLSLTGSTTEKLTYGLFGTVSGTVKNLGMESFAFEDGGMDCRAGSIVGQLLGGTITDCYAVDCTLDVTEGTTGYIAGGIAGCNYAGTIENCFVMNCTVKGHSRCAALVADCRGDASTSDRPGTVKNCYSDSTLAGSQKVASYIIDCESYVITTRFSGGEIAIALGDAWGQTIGTDEHPVVGGPAVYKNTCGDGFFYANDDTDHDEHTMDGITCSLCGNYQAAQLITEDNYAALGVDASYVGAYAISNAGQLYWYAALTNGMLSGVPMDYYASGVLLADLDLEGRDWIPIGLYEETIDGIYLSTCWGSDNVWDDVNQRYTTYFDGRGHTISNFNAVGENSQGLFGYIYCASILNLTVKNATASGWNAGAIAGYPYECLIENCSAIGCTISGETATEDSTYSIVGAMTGSPYGYLYNSFAYDCTVLRARAEDRLYALGGLEDDGYVYNSVYSKVRYGYVGDETLTEFDDGLCMTEENMVSGYVAYLLSQGYSEESYTVSGDIWGQTLGTDACPVLGGQTVYQVTDCQQVITYSNTQHQNGTHVYENGFCIWYDCYEPCGGSGTAEDPYTIANAGQLYWFAAVVNEGYGTVAQNTAAHAKLTADIVVNEGTTNARVWVPIGVYDGSTGDGFGGIFDGDHHTVSGLYYPNDISYVCVALFRCLKGESAEIRNVGLLDSYFYNFAGAAIVGYNEGGTVKNCYNASKIHAGHNAAGIVGRNKGLITYCYNTGEFPYHPLSAGGIAVENYGTISNCYNAGDFVLCNKFGGIACENFNGVIRDCYNTGELHGTNGGGITYSGGTVTNCYSTGRVSCLDLGSGIATKATVENCYYLEGTYHSSRYEDYLVLVGVEATKTAEEFSSGEVAYLLQSNCEEQIWGQKLGEEEYPVFSDDVVYQNQIGGCTEENFAYEYSNTEAEAITTHPGQWTPNWEWDPDGNGGCYVSVELHCDDCGELVGFYSGDAQLISEVKPINCQNPGSREWTITFTVQDREFTDTYTEVVYNDTHISFDGNGFCTVCGGYQKPTVDPGEDPEWDYDDVYLIYNAGQLYWFANHVNNVNNGITGKLMADIDLNPGYTFYADGTYTGGDSPRMWTPIGGGYPCYAGNFDGNGFTVSGAYTVSEGSYVGLFGNTDYNYTIENLGITNSYFEGADHVGGLIGYAYTIVKNCYVTDTVYVSGDYDTAALIGYNGGEVYNSYAMADTFVDTNYGSCYNCYALTENDGITAVTAEDFVSGKVAYLLQSGVTEEDIYDEDWNWIGSYIPEIWGQTIGEDDYPVLKGAKVYEVTNCKDETAYSNTNAALGHNYVDGTCTVCGSARPATVPTLTAKNVSLSFEDEILVNVYFTAADAADVKNYGLLLFSEKVASPTFDTAIAYTEGWYESKGYLGVTTPGIAAKNMGDTLYFAVYAVLADGTYAYSKTYTYAPTTYAYNMLGKSTTPAGLKPLIVAMLNYGAAAQVYFNYNTDNLVNAKLTDEQKALVVDYNGDMLDGLNVCMDDKKGELFGSGNTGFDKNTPSVNFEGAFSVNLYFGQPKATVGSDVTFYVWDKATYESVETLLPENAIATSKCTFDGTYYVGIVEGIAAKEVDETFYCAAVYTGEDGNTYVSGVISYSLGYYLENQAAGTAMPEFAQATGVYAYYAKTLFNA